MVNLRSTFLLLVLSLVTLAQPVEKTYVHGGQIIDEDSRLPIRAYATAYGSDTPDGDDGCPKFKEKLDETRSNVTGSFEFVIDSQKRSYLATYCQGAYVPKKVPFNLNIQDGTRIDPAPIELYPTRAKIAADHKDGVSVAYTAVNRVIERAQGNLRYFVKADPDSFKAALEKMPDKDRDVVWYLLNRTENASH